MVAVLPSNKSTRRLPNLGHNKAHRYRCPQSCPQRFVASLDGTFEWIAGESGLSLDQRRLFRCFPMLNNSLDNAIDADLVCCPGLYDAHFNGEYVALPKALSHHVLRKSDHVG